MGGEDVQATIDEKKTSVLNAGKLLSASEVLQIWPITREYLSRLTHHKDENERLPCIMFGRKPTYPYDELMWWREKHRFVPKRKKAKS